MAAPLPDDSVSAAPSPAPTARRVRLLVIALALLPPFLVLRVIWRSSVDVPFWDQWELVSLLDKSFDGWPSLGDLFAAHNEHRVGFPRIVMVLLARASAWNVRAELVASVLVALGTFAVVHRMARRTAAPLEAGGKFTPAILSSISFSLVAWENWTWGWQLQIFMCVAAVTGALTLLGGRTLGRSGFGAALVLTLIATYSFGNGALAWPLGLVLIALRDEPIGARRLRAAIWSAAAVLVVAPYLIDYHPPPVSSPPRLFQLAAYVPIYLGAPLIPADARGAALVGALGLLALPALVVALLRSGRLGRGELLSVVGLATYALVSGVLTSASRAGLGHGQALSSRYTTISALFWLALVVLLDALTRARADGAGERPTRATRLSARIAIGMIVALSLVASEHGRVQARRHARALGPAREALRDLTAQTDDALLGRLYAHPVLLRERVPVLERRRLSVFREDR